MKNPQETEDFFSFTKNVIIGIIISFSEAGVKKVFLEISQNSQEKTCARVSVLIKL